MIDPNPSRDVRLVTVLLAILCGVAAFAFLMMIGGGIALAMLLAFGIMIVAGLFHYLVWGRSLQQEARAGRVYGPSDNPPLSDRPVRR